MERTIKTSMPGKIIAIIASGLMIVFALGKWLDLRPMKEFVKDNYPRDEVRYILDDFEDKYSLLEVPDLVEDVEYLVSLERFGVSDTINYIPMAVIGFVTLLGILNIILSWYSYRASKVMTIISCILCASITAAFVGAIFLLNLEMDVLSGGADLPDKVMSATFSPYCMVALSVIACVAVRIKEPGNGNVSTAFKVPAAPITPAAPIASTVKMDAKPMAFTTVVRCEKCGNVVDDGDKFCNKCGNVIKR